MEEHYRRLERMYLSAPCNQGFADLRLEITAGRAIARYTVTPNLLHAAGGLHGCYFFKALDDAAFFAASSAVPDVFVLTAEFSTQFLRQVTGGAVVSEGCVVKAGRSLIFAEAVMRDAEGRELARGRGTFARGQAPLGAVPAYR